MHWLKHANFRCRCYLWDGIILKEISISEKALQRLEVFTFSREGCCVRQYYFGNMIFFWFENHFISFQSSSSLRLLLVTGQSYIDVAAGLRSPSLLDKGPFSQKLLLQFQTSSLQEVVSIYWAGTTWLSRLVAFLDIVNYGLWWRLLKCSLSNQETS